MYLKKVGVKELEFILLTHAHLDHAGGLKGLIKDKYPFKVGTIYMKKPPKKSYAKYDENVLNAIKIYEAIKNGAEKRSIRFKNPSEEQVIKLGNMKIKLYNTMQRLGGKKTNLCPGGKYDYQNAKFAYNKGNWEMIIPLLHLLKQMDIQPF